MRRLWTVFLVIGAMVTLWPAAAAAQGPYLSVGAGVTTGGIANGARPTYGGAIGVDTTGLFAVEGEFGYTVRIANEEGTYGDNVRTLFGQVLVGPRLGRARVFGSAGGGLIGAVGQAKHVFTADDEEAVNVFGFSVGGGVMTNINNRLGFRVDGRYFRALEADTDDPDDKLTFIRIGAALMFRF
jgi:opacity protein-like surface antigen